MSEERSVADFDPYSEWLGIATDRSPPGPRDLLGLPLDAISSEAIRQSARERSAKVRKYCLGSRGGIANRLLGELAAAQNALLSQLETLHDAGEPLSSTHAEHPAHETPVDPPIAAHGAHSLVDTAAEPAGEKVGDRSNADEIINAELVRPLSTSDALSHCLAKLVKLPAAARRRASDFDGKLVQFVGEENTIVLNFVRLMATVVVSACLPLLYVAAASFSRSYQARAELNNQRRQAEAGLAAADDDRLREAKRLFDEAADRFAEARKDDLASVVRAAKSRAQKAKEEVETLLGTAPAPSALSDGRRLIDEAVTALNEERFENAKQRFDEAAELFAMTRERLRAEAEARALLAARVNSVGMKFCRIPAGAFEMGQNDGDADERPVHRVQISRAFYLGMYEVTQVQYRKVTGDNPSEFQGDELPVENLSAIAAERFCRLLTEREHSSGLLPRGAFYRLPTEAEWEYAARAGTTTNWCCGNDDSKLAAHAWYSDRDSRTHPVGRKQPNAWGLFDMHGNVSEWCSDSYEPYRNLRDKDPARPETSSFRVLRGGSFSHVSTWVRSAARLHTLAKHRTNNLGFRVAWMDP